MAYQVSIEVMEHLDFREKNGYQRVRSELTFDDDTCVDGIIYIATEENPAFLGPATEAEIALHIAQAEGPSGPNSEYLLLLADALRKLPDGAAVLIQKPMGESLEQAEEILQVCREKNLVAAINFQLRYAPYITMARDAIQQGLIGDLVDVEVRVNVETPWHLWEFLNDAQSAELYYHSIHYVDMIRSFLGNPNSVQCHSMGSHTAPKIDCTRSAYSLDYGSDIRVNINTNHGHRFGKRHQESFVKFEGTKGAIKAQMGLLMDYPEGEPDWFEICILEEGKEAEWQSLPLNGSWFPHAFIGSMGELMYKLENPSAELSHSVEDVIHTMKTVDAAERSSLSGGTPIS